MAVTTPTVNSLLRLLPDTWSGAYQIWGHDNREAAIRVPSNATSPSPTHIEFKTSDAAANPYLALGCLIACGMDGLRQKMKLPEAVQVNPSQLKDSERKKQGIQTLPADQEQTLKSLSKDKVLNTTLGSELIKAYLAVKQEEYEVLKTKSFAEVVKLLLTRY